MSYRKDQEAARDRAAKPISIDEFMRKYHALNLGRDFHGIADDTVHRMFADAQKANRADDESHAYQRYSFEDIDWGPARRETFYWNGPRTGWTKAPPYNWKEDPDCTDKFRVLPDGAIDLHPSQWSVIA